MRYIPHTTDDWNRMLQTLGVASVDELFRDIPESARLARPLNLPKSLTEAELQKHMAVLADKNRSVDALPSFLGGGFYDRYIPSAVASLAFRGEFATAYTPYQPELSQGTLAAIYEFQSMMAGLTGMHAAQASMYDGASSVGEAALLALSHTRRNRIVFVRGVHPDSIRVTETYMAARGGLVSIVDGVDQLSGLMDAGDVAAVVIQYPDMLGRIVGLDQVIALTHRYGALAVVSADPVALSVLVPPGEHGADIVIGEGQPLGNRLNFGGPTFGYFAVTTSLVRKLPGRLVGATVDRDGKRGFVLTLQAREQHIRREKATSNICSNHSLNALQATIYMALVGPQGLREVAMASATKAHYLMNGLQKMGIEPMDASSPFLYEFVVKIPGDIAQLNESLLERGLLGGFDLGQWDPKWKGYWQIAVTEKRTIAECDRLIEGVKSWMSR